MRDDYILFNYLVDSGTWAKLQGAARGLLGVLVRHGDDAWTCFLKDETVAGRMGSHPGSVYRAREQLERLGLLTYTRTGRAGFYKLHLPQSKQKTGKAGGFSSAAPKLAPTLKQIQPGREKWGPRSIALLTDSSSSGPAPAFPPEAAAMLARLQKNGIRANKAAEYCARWPLPVLEWLARRLEKKKPPSPTGFAEKLLADEGPERAAAAAAAQRQRQEAEELVREKAARESREKSAALDVEAMTRQAWERMTPAQRIGLHQRAAESAVLPSSRRKLERWEGGEPLGQAWALLRDDLAGR